LKITRNALDNGEIEEVHLYTIKSACPLYTIYYTDDKNISKEGDTRWINSDYNEIIMIVEIKKRRLALGMSCFPLILKNDTIERLFADGILDKKFVEIPKVSKIANVSFDHSIVRFIKNADEAIS